MSIFPSQTSAPTFGLLAGAATLAIGGLYVWAEYRKRTDARLHAPAAAFAGEGAYPGAFDQTRDAGPEHIRDEDGSDWDALDQASDESFPSSDPPTANDFRTPKPIGYEAKKP